MSLQDDSVRAERLLQEREEWAALAWGWADYLSAGASSATEWGDWCFFDDTIREQAWFQEARERLWQRGKWPFDERGQREAPAGVAK